MLTDVLDRLSTRALMTITGTVVGLALAAFGVVLIVVWPSHYAEHSKACHTHGMSYWQDRDVCVIERPVP